MKIVAVSYLNTKPFVHAITSSANLTEQVQLTLLPPHLCAAKLLEGSADLALIPTGAYIAHSNLTIPIPYGIISPHEVYSVAVVSHEPIEQIREIVLDHESTTSVLLTKILVQRLWHISPQFIPATAANFEAKLAPQQAALVIGDRANKAVGGFAYRYDIAAAWRQLTGLPCVFAVWAAKQGYDSPLFSQICAAFETTLDNLPAIAKQYAADHPRGEVGASEYLTQHLSYRIGVAEQESINLFASYCQELSREPSLALRS